MEHITVKEILEATGGRLLCGSADTPLDHLSIDSRTMKGNDLFVPLVGLITARRQHLRVNTT